MSTEQNITNITKKRFRLLPSLLVVLAVVIVTFLETNVPALSRGLAGTPYILIVAVAALWGDYLAGTLAIAGGLVGLDYSIPPGGVQIDGMTAFKLLEFLLASALICLLTWEWRAVQRSNVDLSTATHHLQTRIKYLQTKYKGDKKKMAELTRINKDLEDLVDQFLRDEHYWQSQMEQTVSKIKLKGGSQAPKRTRP